MCDNKYETWEQFQKILAREIDLPIEKWAVMQYVLLWAAIHEPFCDCDIEQSLQVIKTSMKVG